MFTGIITGTGKIQKIDNTTKNRSAIKLKVDLGKNSKGLMIGQSVALNGVCLSVTKISKNICSFEMIDETMRIMNVPNSQSRSGEKPPGHPQSSLHPSSSESAESARKLLLTPWETSECPSRSSALGWKKTLPSRRALKRLLLST